MRSRQIGSGSTVTSILLVGSQIACSTGVEYKPPPTSTIGPVVFRQNSVKSGRWVPWEQLRFTGSCFAVLGLPTIHSQELALSSDCSHALVTFRWCSASLRKLPRSL